MTGRSSGIGEQFIHGIVARGDRAIATSRNASKRLPYLEDAGAAILDLDITAPEVELDPKVQKALGIYGGLDDLVNNAAYIEAALFEEVTSVSITISPMDAFIGGGPSCTPNSRTLNIGLPTGLV